MTSPLAFAIDVASPCEHGAGVDQHSGERGGCWYTVDEEVARYMVGFVGDLSDDDRRARWGWSRLA